MTFGSPPAIFDSVTNVLRIIPAVVVLSGYADKLNREPTIHMGPAATAMEREGIRANQNTIQPRSQDDAFRRAPGSLAPDDGVLGNTAGTAHRELGPHSPAVLTLKAA